MRHCSFPKSLILIGLFSLGVTSTPFGLSPVASEGASEWKPAPPPDIYPLNVGPNAVPRWDEYNNICGATSQLDCFESVSALIEGSWVDGIKTSNPMEYRITGLVNEDGRDLVQVNHLMNYSGNIFHSTSVAPSVYVDSRPRWEDGETDCDKQRHMGRNCEGALQKGVKFRVSYRSSWVLPTVLSAKLTETKATIEKLAQSGATRVTVEGIPQYFMAVTDEETVKDPNGRGAWDVEYFSVSVTDGRFYPIKKECIEKETLIVAENGYGHPLPSFRNNELSLKASAPHFRPDGLTKHIGFYNAVVPLDTARCLWGEDISNAAQFSVEVFESSTGEAKTATTSVKVEGGALRIDVVGFTYSEPTIRVKYTPPSKVAEETPAVTTAPVVAPVTQVATKLAPKPKGVKLTLRKGAISTTFTRAAGTTYSAVATTKGSRKALKCSAKKTKVTCATKGLKKGQWKLTITPSVKKVKGTSYVKTVRIK